jgi:hypothetical protein
MGQVDAFRVSGLDLWFNSADHKPPHFHAERIRLWEIRVYFLRDSNEMVEKAWGQTPRKQELKRLLALTEEHRVQLLEEWERKVIVRDPGPDR